MSRRNIHVTRRDNNSWAVIGENKERASSIHKTQAEAIEAAKEIANNSKEAEVFIHNLQNRIRERNTYGGKDPYPPPG